MPNKNLSNLHMQQKALAKPTYSFDLNKALYIPQELCDTPQWVNWKYMLKEGRWTKVPYCSDGKGAASTINSVTWSTFQQACDACKSGDVDGIGFVFTKNDPYLGIDLDPYKLAKSNQILPEMTEIISGLDSYTESSPSGEGYHVIVRAKLPQNGRKSAVVEMYDQGRFFTFTGDYYPSSPVTVNDAQKATDELLQLVFGHSIKDAANDPSSKQTIIKNLTDDEVLDKLRSSAKFIQLWAGRWQEHYPSQSEADLALAGLLVGTGVVSEDQLDRLFRQSGLFREKWDELRGEKTYGQITIEKALESAVSPIDSALLDKMNGQFAIVTVGSKVLILEEFTSDSGAHDIRLMGKADFQLLKANELVQNPKNAKQQIDAGLWWTMQPARRQYKGVVFKPEGNSDGYFNLWHGFPIPPRHGDCSLFWDLLLNVICAGNENLYQYVRKWLAHMMQHPAKIPGVALVLRGGQGTGKNTFVDAVGKLVGKQHYMSVARMGQVSGKFNAHLKAKILLNANEACWGGNKQDAGSLKSMITDETITIEYKGKDAITVSNYLRVIVCSNEDWAVPIDIDDRRFLPMDVSDIHKQDHKYFAAFHQQMDNGGYEALMYDLLQEDLTGFLVEKKPDSPFGLDMKIKSADSVTRWLYEALQMGIFQARGYGTFATYSSGDSWPKEEDKDKLYGAYILYCGQMRDHHPEERSNMFKIFNRLLGDAVKEVRPNAKPLLPQWESRRVRVFRFSSLSKCRANFAQNIGVVGLKWPKV